MLRAFLFLLQKKKIEGEMNINSARLVLIQIVHIQIECFGQFALYKQFLQIK